MRRITANSAILMRFLRKEKPIINYIRVTQLDGQMAWSSPIWMRSNRDSDEDSVDELG